jgi:hypothetical protein
MHSHSLAACQRVSVCPHGYMDTWIHGCECVCVYVCVCGSRFVYICIYRELKTGGTSIETGGMSWMCIHTIEGHVLGEGGGTMT